ncbi:MAG: hypothetical protein FD123_1872 [Bacteroidetes bacterium]|nr:MAG: hypothetical protein FD123_1872 [Bacteroidota bacterium]
MNIRIITEAPLWFIVFCLLAGAVYAAVLYYRDQRMADAAPWLRKLMAGLRFMTVSILAFLLLSPLLKMISREVEKPVVVVALDNSESLVLNKDSAFYRNGFPEQMKTLIAQLSEKYEVRTYSFGERFREGIDYTFKDKETDISALFGEIETRFSDRNLGAIIIASDGIYNKGSSPVSAAGRVKVPVFTIALGDTTVRRDLVLSKVLHNRIAYFGNTFPLEAVIDARRCSGAGTTLTVSKNGQTLFSQKIDIKADAFNLSVPIQVEAKEAGLQRYRVALTPVGDEASETNNFQDVFIEVLDGREKILIVSDAPHPDVGALKQCIETNDNYEVESVLLSDFNTPLKNYNLVILHGLPSPSNGAAKLLTDIEAANLPVWYITGAESSFSTFNALKAGISIQSTGSRNNDAEVVLAPNFPLFTISEPAQKYFSKFPALTVPFGSFTASSGSTVLFTQKIGSLKTNYPLLIFGQQGERKTCVLAGEGLWRWRLRDYADHQNQDVFNELVGKTVQYLSVKVDKSFFRILTKGIYSENEPVMIDAELYNDSYELINEPEVSMNIINEKDKRFSFTFSKTAKSYRLNAGQFPVGEYRYEARVKSGQKVLTQSGRFSISPVLIESVNTTADHQALFNLSKKHNGDLLGVKDLAKLTEILNAREDIKPVIYNPKRLVDFINLEWIFFTLFFLLSLEWFLRKRHGTY